MRKNLMSNTMVVDLVMSAPIDRLCLNVMQRGLLAGFNFYVGDNDIASTRASLRSELEAVPQGLQLHADAPKNAVVLCRNGINGHPFHDAACVVHVLDASEHEVSQTHGFSIVIHDMLPEEDNLTSPFTKWASMAVEGRTPSLDGEGGYWCSINDVSAALVRLLPHLAALEKKTYHIAGRRYWTLQETWSEFAVLARRAKAGLSGQFNLEVLAADDSLPIEAQPVSTSRTNPARPDIASFHRCLEQHTGEGWRPVMPLRQTLMLVLASLDAQA
jgi:hypothetical protein